jgi:hypothetical protein
MATEVVVNQILSDEMIVAGADLTRLLDEAKFPFSASLWFFTPEDTWRFVIASSEVRTRGPRWAYRQVQSVLSRIPNPQSKIPLKDITVLDSDDPLIKLLKVAIKTGSGIQNIRFRRNIINGIPIEDAYIYRLT